VIVGSVDGNRIWGKELKNTQVSISPTFYWQLFSDESFFQSFSLITVWLCNFFWHKEIGAKAACKMLLN